MHCIIIIITGNELALEYESMGLYNSWLVLLKTKNNDKNSWI